MTVEITSRDDFDRTLAVGDLAQLVNDLNIASAAGKHFVIVSDVEGNNIALETRNITKLKELSSDAIVRG